MGFRRGKALGVVAAVLLPRGWSLVDFELQDWVVAAGLKDDVASVLWVLQDEVATGLKDGIALALW
jgi:hypothetical protein